MRVVQARDDAAAEGIHHTSPGADPPSHGGLITNRRKDTAGDGDRGRSRPSAVTGVDLRVPNDELGRVLHAGTGADIGAVLRASNDTGHSSSSTFGSSGEPGCASIA